MVESAFSSSTPPWPVRWAVGAPVVAAACVLFFAKAWGQPWHGPSVAVVAVMAWIFAVLAQWAALRPGAERMAAAAAVGAAAAVAFYWAGWRLPRGLVLTGLPVAALAIFQCLLGLGRHHPLPLRAAVIGGSAGAVLVVLNAPLDWPPVLRIGLVGVVVAGAVSVWREAGRVRVGDGSQRLARAIIFAAGVWLPLVWWRPGALLMEFLRWENAAFLALVLLVAWARPGAGAGPSGLTPARRRGLALAALLLAAAAAAGFLLASARGMVPPGTIFLGGGVGSLALLGWVGWTGRPGGVAAWWPEVALLVMAGTVLWR